MTQDDNDSQEISDLKPEPVILLLLDGWGIATNSEANAWSLAETPNIKQLIKEYPSLNLDPGKGDLNIRYLSLGTGYFFEADDDPAISQILSQASDLSSLVAANNLKQLKIFDSERVAALSYFFNAKREERLEGEDWQLISALNKQKVYDPYLSLDLIFKTIYEEIEKGDHQLIIASTSIIDYLASTATWQETVDAIEELDKYLGRLVKLVLNKKATLIISSSQGKSEKMKDLLTEIENRAMTNNPVPFIVVNQDLSGKSISYQDLSEGDLSLIKPEGALSDVAPSIAKILGIDHPNSAEKSLF